MRTMRSVSMIAMILAACFAGGAFAQDGAGRNYNPNTEIAAKGTVEKVTSVTDRQGWYGVHLFLKSQDRTYDVRLGPSDFLSQNNFTFAPGDRVEVWGSQVVATMNTVVARAIEINGQTLTLRDADGFPVWAGMNTRGGYGRGYSGCPGCGCRHHGCGCGCRGGCGGN